jgi:hypothetical protein
MVAHWQRLAAGGQDFRAQPLSSASVPRPVGIGCALVLMQHWLVMVVCSTKRAHLQAHALRRTTFLINKHNHTSPASRL